MHDDHKECAVAVLMESADPHQETIGYSSYSDEVIATAACIYHATHDMSKTCLIRIVNSGVANICTMIQLSL